MYNRSSLVINSVLSDESLTPKYTEQAEHSPPRKSNFVDNVLSQPAPPPSYCYTPFSKQLSCRWLPPLFIPIQLRLSCPASFITLKSSSTRILFPHRKMIPQVLPPSQRKWDATMQQLSSASASTTTRARSASSEILSILTCLFLVAWLPQLRLFTPTPNLCQQHQDQSRPARRQRSTVYDLILFEDSERSI